MPDQSRVFAASSFGRSRADGGMELLWETVWS